MSKLWQTTATTNLHPLIEAYTVGQDYLYDQQLIGYDIAASKAHAAMLAQIKILSPSELADLTAALDQLHTQWEKGDFTIRRDQEDGHTAIEEHLVETLGATGKKIHTGRSRNDQAMVMMRLYLKAKLSEVSATIDKLATSYQKQAQKLADQPMPGYTHMQKAMPTTVGVWLGSYSEALLDMKQLVDATAELLDQNPLGSAAGFGSALNIDRQFTTDKLGFSKIQHNPMYCGLSRGIFELMAVQALTPVMTLAGKFSQDMLLFTTQEFNFFRLPKQFTTGSSIMPHKQNYDVFEIMRGHAHAFSNFGQQLQVISCGNGSGYNRDLQLTKGITLEAFALVLDTLKTWDACVQELTANKDILSAAMTEELLTVAEIDKLVQSGMPFRDAYIQVKQGLQSS